MTALPSKKSKTSTESKTAPKLIPNESDTLNLSVLVNPSDLSHDDQEEIDYIRNTYQALVCGTTGMLLGYYVNGVNQFGGCENDGKLDEGKHEEKRKSTSSRCRLQLHRAPVDNDKIGYLPRWRCGGSNVEMKPTPLAAQENNTNGSESKEDIVADKDINLQFISVRRASSIFTRDSGADGITCRWRLRPGGPINR